MLSAKNEQAVAADDVSYFKAARGFYAEPATPGSYPSVVMIHEWWGLNDNLPAVLRT